MPDAERDSASPSCSCVPDFPVVLRLLEFFSMSALRVPLTVIRFTPLMHFTLSSVCFFRQSTNTYIHFH